MSRPPARVLYLVRHGRTALNAAGALRGRLDPPLDAVGRAEAAALGRCFAGVDIDAVVSSPLQRAVATADAIAVATGHVVEPAPDLLDRDYGPWAGTPSAAVVREHGSVDAAPGVEPLDGFTARVAHAARAFAARHPRLVLVAHEAVNRAIIAELTGVGRGDPLPQRTGCWNRLDAVDGRWVAVVVDALPDDGHRP